MALGIRIRVIWDDTLLEDRLYLKSRILLGSGEHADVALPAAHGRYAALTRRGEVIELTVAPGAVDVVEFPGEDPIDASRIERPLERTLAPPFGSGRLRVAGATVEFERSGSPGRQRDSALWGYAAVACLVALGASGGAHLRRAWAAGESFDKGRPPLLTERDANRMRVQIGPSGAGASRPQAGSGTALVSRAAAPPRARRNPPARTEPPPRARATLLDQAEQALLAADLRKAIDAFSRADREQPLDYDRRNWLGLAQYLSGQYQAATEEWQRAVDLDGQRADAYNNLASVQKRLGQTAREIELLEQALARQPEDCHASNSLALALAKLHRAKEAEELLAKSDGWCGGGYAYTSIQAAALHALAGATDEAFGALEEGLKHVDTLIPVKEFEVLADLRLDPAFASLRADGRFRSLVSKYLPRAAGLTGAGKEGPG